MRDFNDLFFFAAVVQHGGISAAARVLEVPKSRISRRVAMFEAQLGVRLLERSTRRFHVTEIGQQVYRHARAAISEAVAIDEVVARVRSEPRGLVRVSCPSAVRDLVALALPSFLGAHPLLRIQLVLTNRRIDLVEEGVDVAIRVRETLDGDGDLQLRRIGTSRRILVATTALLDRVGRPTVPADLGLLPTIDTADRPGAAIWELVSRDGVAQRIAHEPRLSAGDFALLERAALAGTGIALLPEPACLSHIASGALERVLPDWGTSDGLIHLVFTSRRGLLPGVRAAIEFLADTLKVAVVDR